MTLTKRSWSHRQFPRQPRPIISFLDKDATALAYLGSRYQTREEPRSRSILYIKKSEGAGIIALVGDVVTSIYHGRLPYIRLANRAITV